MTFFTWLATFLAITGGTWSLFVLAQATDPSLKAMVNHWISRVTSGELVSEWSRIFVKMFDALFGQRKFSVRFFFVSSTTSICFAATLLLLWATLYPNEVKYYFTQPWLASRHYIILFFLFSNIIPDYVSNCQTRFTIGKCAQYSKDGGRLFAWILLDFVLTCLISVAVIVPLAVFAYDLIVLSASDIFGYSRAPKFSTIDFLTLHSSEILSRHDDMTDGWRRSLTLPYGLFFYSTFLTSMWLWLHNINAFLLAAFDRFLGVNAGFLQSKKFQKTPLNWLGAISGAFFGALFLLVTLIKLLF